MESHRPRTQSPKFPLVKRMMNCADSGEAEDVELRGDSIRLGVSTGRKASRMRSSRRRALRGGWVGVVGWSKLFTWRARAIGERNFDETTA